MEWRNSNPVYPVRDVARSIEWYGHMFGFEPVVVNPPDDVPVYAVLDRDSVSLHLLRKDEAPHGLGGFVEAQFVIDGGLDELFEQIKERGVKVIQSPLDRPWGSRDFIVADHDDNLVWVSVPLTR